MARSSWSWNLACSTPLPKGWISERGHILSEHTTLTSQSERGLPLQTEAGCTWESLDGLQPFCAPQGHCLQPLGPQAESVHQNQCVCVCVCMHVCMCIYVCVCVYLSPTASTGLLSRMPGYSYEFLGSNTD